MKISISWVFDHIDADWRKQDIARLAELFIQTTSEIDRVYKVEIDARNLTAVQVTEAGDQVKVHSPELKKDFILPKRTDAKEGKWYLVTHAQMDARWTSLADVGSSKDGLMPSLDEKFQNLSQTACSLADGSWKRAIETEDYIFELDNKSINHRPDLWGHRGVAREVAAMLNLKLKSLDPMLENFEIQQYEEFAPLTQDQPFSVSIENERKCSRFATLYLHDVHNRSSDLPIALRLARLDSKPIDAIVDATNYTMFDLGHPMHAFDAAALGEKNIEVRNARNGEKITLLDGQEYILHEDDLVVAAGVKALALAGIMGGLHSAVTQKTDALLIEAACFDATAIRKSAERAKLRTEASARFEKSLDPNGNLFAIRRFAKLLNQMHIAHTASKSIHSLGKPVLCPEIVISHEMIEKQLGVQLSSEKVVELLKKIDFGVEELKHEQMSYAITVPTFRATKDIQEKEDIVEEVGRLYGYRNIVPELPTLQLKPADLHIYNRVKKIKDTCAFVNKMREVANYNFFDEAFIQSIGWEPGETLAVRSPVSQNWQRLVTTLIPNLLKGIQENCADYDQLRFFELARVYEPGPEIVESKRLAGLMFEKKKQISFYDGKALLHNLFDQLGLEVTWHKVDAPEQPWYVSYQTALIQHKDQIIGVAGMMPQPFLHKMSDGSSFVFELDADFLIAYQAPMKKFKASSKYQPVIRDMSLLVPADKTVADIAQVIQGVDARIEKVVLIDYLEHLPNSSGDYRAATFRFEMVDETKTLTKSEIDLVVEAAADAVKACGASIR